MHLPDATYRLQFRNGTDFAKAVELVPHFVGLGISHLYASPLFTAVRGSTHGYDMVCYDEIDPSLGGYDGFVRLVHALKAEGLGLVLDIVPNHMAAHLENDWWHSVIEWGRGSDFADHFDIDWGAPLTLPFLGRSFEDEVAAGNMRLAYDHERRCLALDYYGALYPLNPATYAAIPRGGNAVLERIAAIAGTAERKTAAQFHAEIAAVVATPSLAAELDRYLARLSADKQQLGRLHRMQSWQLMNWRVARDKLSYRRFFEIAGLVGMRVEDEGVFADTHRLTLALVREGLVDGLRIDHIDGLADPKGYLDRLREETGDGTYIIVEKILAENETLPAGWPVEGTTGYEFISALADLLSDDTPSSWLSSEERRSAAEAAVTGCKLQVLGRNFNTEVRRLTGLVARFTGNGVPDRDEQTGEAIRRLIAALPVYRTYVGDQGAGARDSRILDGIAAKAAARAPAAGDETATIISAFTAPIDSLGGKLPAEFRTRFQQLSGAVMAKAVEDTFFYRRGDYLAANEVGASPFWTPGGVGRFHAMMQDRASQMPYGLSATSTHDTKRGEDARARLYVISEASDVWAAAMERWHGMNAASICRLPGGEELEDSVEQFLYQSLLGAWPIDPLGDEDDLISLRERMIAFTVKALREAKLRTSWEDPNERYEAGIEAFLGDLLDWGEPIFPRRFREHGRTIHPGRPDQQPRANAGKAHRARHSGYLSGQRTRRPLPRRSRQPPRLFTACLASPATPLADDRRFRELQAGADFGRPDLSPGPRAGLSCRSYVSAGADRGSGGPARCRLHPPQQGQACAHGRPAACLRPVGEHPVIGRSGTLAEHVSRLARGLRAQAHAQSPDRRCCRASRSSVRGRHLPRLSRGLVGRRVMESPPLLGQTRGEGGEAPHRARNPTTYIIPAPNA